MPSVLTVAAVDKSTYVVTASFTDEDDAAVTPNNDLVYTLTDENGTVINSRQDVALSEDTSVDIVLSGDDLKASDGSVRILTIECTYNSTLGVLPLKDQVRFTIEDLTAVT